MMGLFPTLNAREHAVRFALDDPFLQVVALIGGYLALADAELDFDVALFPIKLQRDEGAAQLLNLASQLVDLVAMQEKTAGALRLVLLMAGPEVRLDIAIVHVDLAILQTRERALEIHVAQTDGLNLGALEFNAAFHAIQDFIIPESFAVNDSIGGHN